MKLLSPLLLGLLLALTSAIPAPDAAGPDDPARPKTHCEKHRDRVQPKAGGPPMAGAYVPQCDANGEYTPQQCHASTGHCWCVDANGREQEGTKTPPGADRVECTTKDDPVRRKTNCEHRRERVPSNAEGRPLIGAYVPQCDANGEYMPQQCHGSTGYCWCVDENGKEQERTKTPPGIANVECTTKGDPVRRKTHCEHRRDNSGFPLVVPIAGAYVPQCDANGEYTPEQCHPSTGYCWCVDANGKEQEGTKTPPGADRVECTTKDDPVRRKTNCEHRRERIPSNAQGRPLIGAYVPQCDANGEYMPQQCHSSTGHCWCVDANGKERGGTRTPPGADRVPCTAKDDPERPKTHCEHRRERVPSNAEGRPLIGAYVPQCDAHGEYTPQQCHGSTGYCWCVDVYGREQAGTKTPPGADSVECTTKDDPVRRKTNCEHRRDRVPSNAGGPPIAGAYVPQCDANGEYTPQQCHGSTGHCWCVDASGKEQEGTRTPPGADRVQCKTGVPDRCSAIEFDAIVPDEKGKILFFKDAYLWTGYEGDAQLATDVFMELYDIERIGHVDAAFRMHNPENPTDHDHIFLFLDDKVVSFYDGNLEEGYPKSIQEAFPGVPSNLSAAVECPKTECAAHSVLFFKGQDVFMFDIPTKTVKTKTWSHLPACTSALRWLEHYYCFHGHNFTRFHPVTGEVSGNYPKDARNFFMKCDNFGHGHGYTVPKCSEVKIDAITTDDTGKSYFFTGPVYMRLDSSRDGLHAFPIVRSWKEVANGVDAVFSHTDKMYMIKDDKVYIYKGGAHYTLIDGYPKTLKEELNIEGHVDAAFVCPSEDTVYVIQGRSLKAIDLSATPRVVLRDLPLPLTNIDAAHCSSDGIRLYQRGVHYHYETPMILAASRITPRPLNIPATFGCEE